MRCKGSELPKFDEEFSSMPFRNLQTKNIQQKAVKVMDVKSTLVTKKSIKM